MNNSQEAEKMWLKEALWALECSFLGQGTTQEAREALLAAPGVRRQQWRAGATVFEEGEKPRGMFLLVRGAVGIRQDTLSGREIFITDIEEAGELFGEVYFLLGQPYDISARSLTASVALLLEAPVFAGAQGEALTRRLLRVLAGKAYQLNRHLRVLGSGSLRGKIAHYLLLPGARPALSREALAVRLAVTRPSLSRELAAMQREGLIAVTGRSLKVMNRAALEEYL